MRPPGRETKRRAIRKFKGTQGSWFARTPNGERLPCVWDTHIQGWPRYHDPFGYDPSIPKHAEYIEALMRGRVILAKEKPRKGDTRQRSGYVAAFKAELTVDANGVTGQFIERLDQ